MNAKMLTTKITLAALILLSLCATIHAQVIYVPIRPPQPPRRPPFLSIQKQHVQTTIDNQAAKTVIRQVFVNETDRDLEGMYIFPIPENASVSNFSMWMNGEKVSGEVLDADEARRIYEDIVRKMKDPGLLEYAGRNMFKARVYPIPAHGSVKIEISYDEVLRYDDGTIGYHFPLRSSAFAHMRLEEVSVAVEISSDTPIKTIYSPSHDIDVNLSDDYVTCGFEERNVAPETDFILYYTVSEEDMGINLLSYKSRREDGYFMLLVSPGTLETNERERRAKDVTFVIDVSGSMKGEKIEQAKDALEYCVEHLNKGDRFNIIAFATDVKVFDTELVPVSRRTMDKALDFIYSLDARGGTNIDKALEFALRSNGSSNPQMIIFLTDGAPTAGETDESKILSNVARRNESDLRIFSFGVGYDVNSVLLDNLSLGNGGTADYIKPQEDIEVKVTSFFSKVSEPVLTDVSIDFDGVKVTDIYPDEMPDIFNGQQLVVFGRYNKGGNAAIEISGEAFDDRTILVHDTHFNKRNRGYDFIPRLWANRKISYLLTEIRLHGENDELIDEVVTLSKEHGIITPYTSYLILEHRKTYAPHLIADATTSLDHQRGGAGMRMEKGEDAFMASRELKKGRDSSVLDAPASSHVRHIGRKTFYQTGEGWIDAAYEKDAKTIEIKYLSDEYFELMGKHIEIGKYLSLGSNVTFVLEGKAYRVSE